ncbi:hypothetical protein PROFUN_16840 [Planoprotostelium fungivorum]|uniref:Uncharacterized protein n=1 Tax=Planoprotostelium fungivorum TaxID=1890364 RepID=A0A2P6MNL8_9EUKA|nr:hypothetical protein PROFUN_16840 [Planoprotostelium fungivorum]
MPKQTQKETLHLRPTHMPSLASASRIYKLFTGSKYSLVLKAGKFSEILTEFPLPRCQFSAIWNFFFIPCQEI